MKCSLYKSDESRIKRNICVFGNLDVKYLSILAPYCLTLGGLESTLILLLTSDLIRLTLCKKCCLEQERAKAKSLGNRENEG